jgi:predicted DNA-binding transcriptional regulator AlpA
MTQLEFNREFISLRHLCRLLNKSNGYLVRYIKLGLFPEPLRLDTNERSAMLYRIADIRDNELLKGLIL